MTLSALKIYVFSIHYHIEMYNKILFSYLFIHKFIFFKFFFKKIATHLGRKISTNNNDKHDFMTSLKIIT